MKRILSCVAVLICLQLLPASEPPALREQLEVRRVRLPVLLDERSTDGCEGVSAADIEILEDGAAAPALRLERGGMKAAHAILIDAGPELLGSIRQAREAALAYVASLPRHDPALLATFDQRLILHSSLSTDRERFARDLEWIETGGGSHLLEAARQVINYLASRPERKVLLLVTDGCDTLTADAGAGVKLIEQAARTESLVIFPIGLNVPQRCARDDSDPDQLLGALAEETGGEYLRIKSAAELGSIFSQVRARLEREWQVTYEPLPFGAAPKDKPRKQSYRWRKLKLRTRGDSDCRIGLAGSDLRFESGKRNQPKPSDAAFDLSSDGRLKGKLKDILRESGPIAPSLDVLFGLDDGGSDDSGRGEQTVQRPVEALVPPINEVVHQDAGPETTLRHALSSLTPSSTGSVPGRWSDIPFLVNGRTLLDARRSLALALWKQPDYRDWARERIRAERLESTDAMIATATSEDEKELLGLVRSYLAEQDWDPEPAEKEMVLGAWLGDIPVSHAFNTAEIWVAQSFLRVVRTEGMKSLPRVEADAEWLWQTLSVWFPEPEETRVMGLLVPGYDPAQDAVGYYRVILSPPYSATIHQSLMGSSFDTFLGSSGDELDPKSDVSLYNYLQSFNFSRQAPLGTRLLRWMLRQEGVGSSLLQGFDIKEVRYAHPGLRDLQPTLLKAQMVERATRDDLYLARHVTVVLESRNDPGQRVAVSAYIQRDPDSDAYLEEPLCLLTPLETPRFEAGLELWRALVTAKGRSELPCVLLSRPSE